jgi:hypothetical protein
LPALDMVAAVSMPAFSIPPKLPPLRPSLLYTPPLIYSSFSSERVLFIQLRLVAQFFIFSPGLTPHPPLAFIQDSINRLSPAKKSG